MLVGLSPLAAAAQGRGRISPRNTLVAAIGDSITVQNITTTVASYDQQSSGGPQWWARSLSRQRFSIPSSYIKGTSGNTTTQMLARITDVTALDAGTVVIQGGVNDVGGGASLATITGNIEAIIAACRAAGQIAVLQCPHPQSSGTAWNATQLGIWSDLNDWMKARHNPSGGVWSYLSAWDDIASTPGGDVAAANMLYDATHPTPRGSYWLGLRQTQMLDQIFPVSEPWDSPATNYAINTGFTGTSGTKNSGITGDVATSWTAQCGATLTGDQAVVASIVTSGGRTWQQFHITGTYASNSAIQLYCVAANWGTTWNIGNVADIAFDVQVDAPASGTIRDADVGCFYKAGTTIADGLNNSSNPGPDAPLDLIAKLQAFTLPADATRIYPMGQFRWLAGTIDMTVRFARPVLHKLA